MTMFTNRSREERVTEFNQAGGNKTYSEGGGVGVHVACFGEELAEFNEAMTEYLIEPTDENRAQMIKEWADCQVTLSNFAWFFEFNGNVAFNRVADSNMSKLVDGKLERREDGKILKGPNYKAPDMRGL